MDIIENLFAPIKMDLFQEGEESFGMFALYLKKEEASVAVRLLERNGFKSDDISLLAPVQNGPRNFVYDQANSLFRGAVIGAVVGAVTLGLIGLFIGSSGLLPSTVVLGTHLKAIEGDFSPVAAAVLAGIGLVLGAAAGVLVGIGSPKSAARRYGFYLKEGGIVLVVHLRKESDRLLVSRILEQTRGQDINILDESKIWSTIIPEKRKLVYN